MNLVVAQRHLADDANHHVAVNVGIGAHPGPLEGGAEDETAVIGNGEDGRAAGLLDLDDLALDHDRLAHQFVQLRRLGQRQILLHLDGVVLLQLGGLKLQVAVGKDVSEGDEDSIAHFRPVL